MERQLGDKVTHFEINGSTKKINSAHDITFFENIQNDHYQFNINLPGLLCSNDCNYEKIDESSFKTRYIMNKLSNDTNYINNLIEPDVRFWELLQHSIIVINYFHESDIVHTNLGDPNHFLLDQDDQIVFCGYGNVRDQLANNHQNLNEFNPTNLKRMDLIDFGNCWLAYAERLSNAGILIPTIKLAGSPDQSAQAWLQEFINYTGNDFENFLRNKISQIQWSLDNQVFNPNIPVEGLFDS